MKPHINAITAGRRLFRKAACGPFHPLIKTYRNMKNRIVSSLAVLFATLSASAQGNGMAGITEATNMVTSYFDPITKLAYAVAAVLGLIGGIKVYSKFSSGDPDVSKTAAGWFFACIFLVVAATVLRSFFL